ncbi:MAG: TylF/MycF family methyltransferase [Candidatus Eremiobacteraeota bacterium]|nr:TylF/MycF family methyltransferase [Candidatus Eremiobacteraeota bacterium]
MRRSGPEAGATPQTLYLDLLKRSLTRTLFTAQTGAANRSKTSRAVRWTLRHVFVPAYVATVRRVPAIHRAVGPVERSLRRLIGSDPFERAEGRDWPADAETMIGTIRLDHLQTCCETVLAENVPGDLIETGVWRGGATILMRAVLAAYGDRTRIVWVADSFAGLPRPDPARFPHDQGDMFWAFSAELAVSLDTVKANFARYGLLDEQVQFLAGWFKDTLPSAPIERLALMRLDGDLYESTMDALTALYPKLSVGGYVIIDDYGALASCRAAVHDFRTSHAITDPIGQIDWTGAYWRRSS